MMAPTLSERHSLRQHHLCLVYITVGLSTNISATHSHVLAMLVPVNFLPISVDIPSSLNTWNATRCNKAVIADTKNNSELSLALVNISWLTHFDILQYPCIFFVTFLYILLLTQLKTKTRAIVVIVILQMHSKPREEIKEVLRWACELRPRF